MSSRKKLVAGFLTDSASVNAAEDILDAVAELNDGVRPVDFREEGLSEKLKDGGQMKGLLSLLSKNAIDIVISSMDTVPHSLPEGIELAAVTRRGNPFNCLICLEQLILEEQPGEVPIAVTDRVNMGQLLYFRPDLLIVEMDSDFQTLDERMKKGEIGGFVTSAAQVESMNYQEKVVEVFTSSICMPAAGQGAMGILTRKKDRRSRNLADHINHQPSWVEVELENIFLDELPGRGKGVAAVLGSVEEDEFRLSAAITAADGSERVTASMHGWRGEEKEIAGKLASQLLEAGGEVLIRQQ